MNNRVVEIDRFAQEGTYSLSGGGAVCVTHGRNSVLRGNTFRDNSAAAFRGYLWSELEPRPLLTWPNAEGRMPKPPAAPLRGARPERGCAQ